jgi:tetratricopeptide (TPR) repeat protein
VSHRRLLGFVLLALAASGCASIPFSASPEAPRPATPSAPRPLNAGVPTPDELAAPHRARAAQLEDQGHLRQAVDAWLMALAFAPDHQPTRRALKQLRERIDREIAEQLRSGWHALAGDRAPEARRHFMAALALDPDSQAARDALRALPVAPASSPLPEVTATVVTARSVVAASAPPARRHEAEETEKPEALYAAAKTHLAARRDGDAYRALVRLARVSPGYKDSAALIRDLRSRLVQQRYQEGLRLFREELIEAAIEQWRGVLEIEPGHDNARRNIEQAEKMLRTLAAQPRH